MVGEGLGNVFVVEVTPAKPRATERRDALIVALTPLMDTLSNAVELILESRERAGGGKVCAWENELKTRLLPDKD